MLPDYGGYYGSALVQIIDHYLAPVTVERIGDAPQGFYLLNGRAPLYLKFSRNRKSPWGFTFHREHQEQYQLMIDRYGDCILGLVCGKDGIAALNYAQMREVLDDDFDEQEGITVRRRLNQMYSVGGANGKLSRKVARDSLLEQVFRLLGGLEKDVSKAKEAGIVVERDSRGSTPFAAGLPSEGLGHAVRKATSGAGPG